MEKNIVSMQKKINYSVVIPAYNCEKTICNTLNSVLNQTRYDLINEVIIVNDGSTDNTLETIKQFIKEKKCKNIQVINKINGGAASARNIGIARCKNRYIALLDADDEWHPQKLELQNKVLVDNCFIKALGCNREGECIRIGKKNMNGIFKISPLQYCIKNWPCTPSLIFDKTVFDEEKPFPEDMSHAEEGIFFLNLAYSCGLYYIQEPLVKCGGGKRAFGASGLSGNLRSMHLGVKKMLLSATKRGYIKKFLLPFLLVYEDIKYIRRIIIVQIGR